GEVSEVRSDRRLPSEVQVLDRQAPQMPPEFSFCVGHVATQFACAWDAWIDFFRFLACGHARPPPLPPPHHSQELAGGGERHRRALLILRKEQGRNLAQGHPSTLPIWRTASSIRLVSASQNALNSAWSR